MGDFFGVRACGGGSRDSGLDSFESVPFNVVDIIEFGFGEKFNNNLCGTQ